MIGHPLFHTVCTTVDNCWNQETVLTKKLYSRIFYSDQMSDLVAYVDGSCLGSPGQAGIGVIIRGAQDDPITVAKWIGRQDNNVAEYMALLEALQCALTLSAKGLHVYSDSEVVVKQMKGAYTCRSSRLYSLNWVCRKLARSLAFSISHIPRAINLEANALAHSAVLKRSGSSELAVVIR